jgi:hypothetical protein
MVSLRLNSGVPATEVVRRARHGVAVLLKIYALKVAGQGVEEAGRAVTHGRRPWPSVPRATSDPQRTDI